MAQYIDVELVRIYCGESDRFDGRPLHEVVVELARRHGAAGATVLRGVLGFGAGSLVHTAKILRLSEDLPIVVELVDRPERMEVLLPRLEAVVKGGLITRQVLRARFHCPVRVRDVMVSDVAVVSPETPLPTVVELLLARNLKAVPVIDAKRKVLGIVTGGDLLAHGALAARLSLQGVMPQEALDEERTRLAGLTARDVMTAPARTVAQRASLREAAEIMTKKGLKRLPVVDADDELIGIVSRVDILRAASDLPPAAAEALPRFSAGLFQQARDVMIPDVPTVGPDTPLPEVVAKIVESPLRRAVVVDDAGKVRGIVLDGDLLSRCGPARKTSLFRALFGSTSDNAACPAGTAREVMQPDVFAVTEDATLMDVLRTMLAHQVKRLVVLDDEGRLRGMVDRTALLRAIAGE